MSQIRTVESNSSTDRQYDENMTEKNKRNEQDVLMIVNFRHRKQDTSFWTEFDKGGKGHSAAGEKAWSGRVGVSFPPVAVPSLGPERVSQVQDCLRLRPPALEVLGSLCQQTEWVLGL